MFGRYVCLAAAAATVLVHFPGAARAATIPVRTSAELQAALEAAQDGDVIEIRAGSYSAVDAGGVDAGFLLRDKSNLTLRAVGRVKIDGGKSVTCLTVNNVDGLAIEGVTFQNSSNDGIFMTGVSDFSATGCTFRKCSDSGIEDRDTAGFVIDRCKFIACGYGLATGYAGEAFRVEVRDSSFRNCTSLGLDLWSSGGLIENCTFSNDSVGVYLRDEFSGSTLRDCTFTKGGTGVYVYGTGTSVSGCSFTKQALDGVLIAIGGANTVSANTISKSGDDGIQVDTAGNTIAGNRISRSGGVDIESDAPESSNTYTDNVFTTSSFGLQP